MADYTIIADVSRFICSMLREKMCPQPVPFPKHIEISSPASGDADYILGLYLYDVKEETSVTRAPCIHTEGTAISRAPTAYSLSYMLYVNSLFRKGRKEADIQKLIGRAAQIINDNNAVYPHEIQPWLDTGEPPIMLSQAKMELEEKTRVWQAVNKPYQISLFYRAAPVFVSSETVADPPRVREALFHLGMKRRKGGDGE